MLVSAGRITRVAIFPFIRCIRGVYSAAPKSYVITGDRCLCSSLRATSFHCPDVIRDDEKSNRAEIFINVFSSTPTNARGIARVEQEARLGRLRGTMAEGREELDRN